MLVVLILTAIVSAVTVGVLVAVIVMQKRRNKLFFGRLIELYSIIDYVSDKCDAKQTVH